MHQLPGCGRPARLCAELVQVPSQSGGAAGSCDELGGRAVQVRAGQCIPALDVAERNVADMAEKPADALSAGAALVAAARVVVVHVDALPLFEWLVTHAAGVLLRLE